jgi:hypothetical protein
MAQTLPAGPRIEDGTLLYRPLPFHIAGLQQTASGYGRKLTSPHVVRLPDGRERRVYVTCFSNAGTAWVVLDGACCIVSDFLPREAE